MPAGDDDTRLLPKRDLKRQRWRELSWWVYAPSQPFLTVAAPFVNQDRAPAPRSAGMYASPAKGKVGEGTDDVDKHRPGPDSFTAIDFSWRSPPTIGERGHQQRDLDDREQPKQSPLAGIQFRPRLSLRLNIS